MLALFVVVPITESTGILLLPLTGTPLLDDYAAGTMAALGFLMLIAEIAALREPSRDAQEVPLPVLVLPAVLPQPDGIYRVRWSASWKQRAIALVVGLVVLADVVPAFAGFDGTSSPHLISPWLPQLHAAVLYTLLGIVLIGTLIAWMGVFERAHFVVAAPEGLSISDFKTSDELSWSDVAQLKSFTATGKIESFKVIGSDLESTVISWPAAARWERGQSATGQPEAAYALATIVAERTGLSWQVVRER